MRRILLGISIVSWILIVFLLYRIDTIRKESNVGYVFIASGTIKEDVKVPYTYYAEQKEFDKLKENEKSGYTTQLLNELELWCESKFGYNYNECRFEYDSVLN